MRSYRLLIPAAVISLVILPATAAFAGPGGWVDVDDDGSEVEVGATDSTPAPATPSGNGGASDCTWARVPADEVASVWWTSGADVTDGEVVDPADYTFYWRSCPAGNGTQTTTLIPVRNGAPAVDPRDLADDAVDQLALPAPTIAMNPTGTQVVHISSWLWVDGGIWRERSKSVSAGSVTTTATARPSHVTWDLGNGDTIQCDGPGVAYDPSKTDDEQSTDCSYTYASTSAGQPGDAYTVTATIEWEVEWTVVGASGGGPLPAMFTTAPTTVSVAEMQALNQ